MVTIVQSTEPIVHKAVNSIAAIEANMIAEDCTTEAVLSCIEADYVVAASMKHTAEFVVAIDTPAFDLQLELMDCNPE